MILIFIIKMIKRLCLFFPVMLLVLLFKTISVNGAPGSKAMQLQINKLADIDKIGTRISIDHLPSPYSYLLTQPLMTKTIEKYYQRTAIIKPIFTKLDQSNNIYYRSIVMLIDRNKARNKVISAQKNNEVLIVEFAFITMNFNALPKRFIEDVLHTNTPFGKLLVKYNLQILTKDRDYFTVKCDKTFASLMHCNLNDLLYGRTNTIIRADNKKWLAHVVEILPKLPQSSLKKRANLWKLVTIYAE